MNNLSKDIEPVQDVYGKKKEILTSLKEEGFVPIDHQPGRFTCKNKEILLNELLILDAIPILIRDILIKPEKTSFCFPVYLEKQQKLGRIPIITKQSEHPSHREVIFMMVFESNQSNHYIMVGGNSLEEITYRLCDLELIPADIEQLYETEPVLEYLRSVIYLTRLANKKVE